MKMAGLSFHLKLIFRVIPAAAAAGITLKIKLINNFLRYF